MKSTLLVSTLVVALSGAAVSHKRALAPPVAATVVGDADLTAERGRSRRLCRLLAKLVPEVRGTGGVGARAQLVTSIGAVFGDDPAVLAVIATSIDEAAIEHCPLQRDELLSAMRLGSLRDAVR
jgi:hypothetical protein